MIHVAVLGYGTIGSGVVEVLERNKSFITHRAGDEINVKYVLDLRDFPGNPVQELITHNYNDILNDPEIQIVVEVMGGTDPAYSFVKAALEAGKSVATSNKELVAKHGAELLRIAEKNSINFLFEASVGGGIPIIRPLNQSLTADEVYEITGILNGTTNYMLTKMSKEGASFDEALKEAQLKGFAERNPAADVEGLDACRKIAILSSLAFGMQVDAEDIYTEGITKISDIDMRYANSLKKVIKLFATSKKRGGEVYAMVSPVMIGEENPLYNVNGVFNAILVRGDVLGDLMFYGSGAGKLPTASAVVADVVDEAKNLHNNVMVRWSRKKLDLADINNDSKQFFVRFSGKLADRIDMVKEKLGDVKTVELPELADREFAVITPVMTEAKYKEKIKSLDGVLSRIRL